MHKYMLGPESFPQTGGRYSMETEGRVSSVVLGNLVRFCFLSALFLGCGAEFFIPDFTTEPLQQQWPKWHRTQI